jgi:endonuclease YncB( thermonuclease family)
MVDMPVECPALYVIDSDTIRCGSDRLRWLGVDAPEIGHCARNRVYVPGNSKASRQSLQLGVRNEPYLRRVTTDRYWRTVAVVWSGKVNLLCGS